MHYPQTSKLSQSFQIRYIFTQFYPLIFPKSLKSLGWRLWTRLFYGWRFSSFGKKSVLGKPLLLTNSRLIAIGNRVEIRSGARLEAFGQGKTPKISIGDRTIIHYGFHCGGAESIEIGQDVLIAGGVFISDHNHRFDNIDLPPSRNGQLESSPVIIEYGVWIGEGAAVLKGVTVGQRAVIGANSVVTKDVPPFTVVGGIPAKFIRNVKSNMG